MAVESCRQCQFASPTGNPIRYKRVHHEISSQSLKIPKTVIKHPILQTSKTLIPNQLINLFQSPKIYNKLPSTQTQTEMTMRRPSYSDSDDEVLEVPAREKPVIKLKEWLHNFKPNNSQNLKMHIMSFLLSEGLFDVAKTFSQEAGVQMPVVNQAMIKQRYEIKNLIRKGQIEPALQKIKQIDPEFETKQKNNELLFSLKCLKVINLIKQGNIEGSIETARLELLPFTKKGEKFVKDTEKVMGLLAFMNLKDCPNKELVKEEHSSKIASRINQHLLSSRQEGNEQALEALLKLGKWCEKRLSQFINFPTINLESQQQIFKQPV